MRERKVGGRRQEREVYNADSSDSDSDHDKHRRDDREAKRRPDAKIDSHKGYGSSVKPVE